MVKEDKCLTTKS